jgi:hypothetical protein
MRAKGSLSFKPLADALNCSVDAHSSFPLTSAAAAVAARSFARSTMAAWPRLSASAVSWRNLPLCELSVFIANQ